MGSGIRLRRRMVPRAVRQVCDCQVARFRLNPCGALILLVVASLFVLYWFSGSIYYITGYAVSMRQVLSVSIQLAERGGVAVKSVYQRHMLNGRSKSVTKEGVQEMLTDGDIRSHQAIIYGFAKSFPALKVISEEHETRPIDFRYIPQAELSLNEVDSVIQNDLFVNLHDLAVWIDPLDATKEYTENLTNYVTVLVCVAYRGSPLIGIIHQPFQNVTYWAWRGYGLSRSLQRLVHSFDFKSTSTADAHQRFIVSRSHTGEAVEVIKTAFEGKVDVIKAGGSGYKTLQLLSGGADVYAHVTAIKKWDICAPNAVVAAAGGVMTDLAGGGIDFSPSRPARLDAGLLAARRRETHTRAVSELRGPLAALRRRQATARAASGRRRQ